MLPIPVPSSIERNKGPWAPVGCLRAITRPDVQTDTPSGMRRKSQAGSTRRARRSAAGYNFLGSAALWSGPTSRRVLSSGAIPGASPKTRVVSSKEVCSRPMDANSRSLLPGYSREGGLSHPASTRTRSFAASRAVLDSRSTAPSCWSIAPGSERSRIAGTPRCRRRIRTCIFLPMVAHRRLALPIYNPLTLLCFRLFFAFHLGCWQNGPLSKCNWYFRHKHRHMVRQRTLRRENTGGMQRKYSLHPRKRRARAWGNRRAHLRRKRSGGGIRSSDHSQQARRPSGSCFQFRKEASWIR